MSGATTLLFCLILIGIIQFNSSVEVQSLREEKSTIEYRLSEQSKNNGNNDSVLVNGGVYEDAVEFNTIVRGAEKWEDNGWVGWFNTKGIKDIGQVDLSEYMK